MIYQYHSSSSSGSGGGGSSSSSSSSSSSIMGIFLMIKIGHIFWENIGFSL